MKIFEDPSTEGKTIRVRIKVGELFVQAAVMLDFVVWKGPRWTSTKTLDIKPHWTSASLGVPLCRHAYHAPSVHAWAFAETTRLATLSNSLESYVEARGIVCTRLMLADTSPKSETRPHKLAHGSPAGHSTKQEYARGT